MADDQRKLITTYLAGVADSILDASLSATPKTVTRFLKVASNEAQLPANVSVPASFTDLPSLATSTRVES